MAKVHRGERFGARRRPSGGRRHGGAGAELRGPGNGAVPLRPGGWLQKLAMRGCQLAHTFKLPGGTPAGRFNAN